MPTYNAIEVTPLTGALGAEIRGVDLSQQLSNRVLEEIHQAFLDNLMIYFRGQTLTPQQQIAAARHFGEPAQYPFLKGLPDAPQVSELLKTEKDTVNFGGVWHSDTAYKPEPDMGSLLYAKEVPEAGGDTMFANMYLAYETLSPGMKRMIEGVVGVNSSERLYKGGRATYVKGIDGMKDAFQEEAQTYESEHPIVRTHPLTGRKALYLSKAHTVRFKDMTEEESRPLIDLLADHAVRPEFTCRLRWEQGTLAIWDNRCTQHFAVNDYSRKRRYMHRVTIAGDRPV